MKRVSWKPLARSFFASSAREVAPRLLGHWLIRKTPSGVIGGPIVEVEAYLQNDPACHGFVGPTKRNETMWGPAGYGYVYLIYGYHHCFNTVCQRRGIAEAVLIRAIESECGEEEMLLRRPVGDRRDLTNGPAKLCAALDIDLNLDGADICAASSPVFIARNPRRKSFLEARGPLITTTRIGLSKAADWPLRFYLEKSPFVSRRAFGSRESRT